MKNPTQKFALQKLFENSIFELCFFIFVFLFILDCYQIVFASIESVFFILDIDNYAEKIGKAAVLNGYEPFIYTSFFTFFEPGIFSMAEILLSDEYSDGGWGLIALAAVVIASLLFALVLTSAILIFSKIKNHILKGSGFGLLFYALLFMQIYSMAIVMAVNARFTPLGHFFMIRDFSIQKMQICILIAAFITLAFRFLIFFKSKYKK